MSERRITRRAAGQRRQGKTDWEGVERLSEEEIAAAAAADEDNAVWTEAELMSAELVLPSDEPKVPVSIWLDREVVDYFKAQGPGYESRIGAVLRAYVRGRR